MRIVSTDFPKKNNFRNLGVLEELKEILNNLYFICKL